RERPGALYLIAPETGRTMTYAQLKRESEALGRQLLAQGLAKGDKVALMLHNSYQAARLLIGVMYSGFTVAPLNLLSQAAQLEYVLEHSDAKLVFASSDHIPQLAAALDKISRKIRYLIIDPDATEIFESTAPA